MPGRLLLFALLLGSFSMPASAVNRTFDGGGLDSDWFNPANWDPDGAPAPADDLTINTGVPSGAVLVEVNDGGSVLLDGPTAGADLAQLQPGRSGNGVFTVQGGADLTTSSFVRLGWFDGSSGELILTGDGSTWVADTLVSVGLGFNSSAAATGVLTVSDQADFSGLGLEVGGRPAAIGTLNVDNATATTSGFITVGAFGRGVANVTSGGMLESTGSALSIGNGSGGVGQLNVDGGAVTTATGMTVGSFGTGTLDIRNGGVVNAGSNTVSIAASTGSTGQMFVDGEGSTFAVNSGIQVGNRDLGSIEITGGADVMSSSTFFGVFGALADGTGLIDGAGSTWTTSGQTGIGFESVGLLELANGGLFNGWQTLVGDRATGDGELYVRDGGVYDGSDVLYIASRGLGTLTVESGGMVENDGRGAIGVSAGSEGDATVSGSGSAWNVNNELLVGWSGEGYLTVLDGGVVNSDIGIIAQGIGSFGDAVVAGAGAEWNNANDLSVGSLGQGVMLVTDGGTVTSVNGMIAASTDATGSVLVGDIVPDAASTATGLWDVSGSLSVGGPLFGPGGPGDLTIGVDGEVRVASETVVWSTGELFLDGGVLSTGELDVADGVFSFTGGTLIADTVTGDVTNQGGMVAPGASPGLTTISGDYTQLADATLQIELGGLTPGTEHDQLIVDGATLNLGGTLELVHLAEYALNVGDVFDVVSFTGTLGGTFDSITTSSEGTLDFDVEVTYGVGVVTVEVVSITALLAGDFNGDGAVDNNDLNLLLANWGQSTVPAEWVNGFEGVVDNDELNALLANWGLGTGASVPEPNAATLAWLALVHAGRRRHRCMSARH